MAYPEYIRQKAVTLRTEQKLTIDEIAERLALPKTTVYDWVRGIAIPRKPGGGFATPAQKLGTRAMQAKYKAIREAAYEEATLEYPDLIIQPGFRDFICMYIGEGYKRRRNEVALCNSDPKVVKLAQAWMLRFASNPVKYSIQFHADQSLDELRAFWSRLLDIEPGVIRLQRKSNSGRLAGRTWRSVHGVMNVHVADTRFRSRLQAWMDLVRAEWQ